MCKANDGEAAIIIQTVYISMMIFETRARFSKKMKTAGGFHFF
jgi:hypothetical protein